ncbi:hypothetical protein YQE_08192, partial [Dendroctonus ponderosae]
MSLNAHVNKQNNKKSWKKPNPANSKENVLRETEKSANAANKHDKDEDVLDDVLDLEEVDVHAGPHHLEKNNRRRRSMVISDRKARSADVGVSGIYEVISEADLAFSPDNRAEAVTVFQGRIREEVVYGICMPVPGFSILFVLVAVSAVVSALVAGTLLYR